MPSATRPETPPALSWTPTPRYALRRACVLRLVRRVRARKVLEIGPGAGDLLARLAGRGLAVTGVDTAEAARVACARRLAPFPAGRILADLASADRDHDLLVALEVLEHIEDDRGALAGWIEHLRPGGHVIVSVPAHRARWCATDRWAGHVRRYDRADLTRLLDDAGLELETLWCYGFPWANISAFARRAIHRRYERRAASPEDRTASSGLDRHPLEHAASWLVTPPLLWPLDLTQRPFLGTEWGNGFVALGRRRSTGT